MNPKMNINIDFAINDFPAYKLEEQLAQRDESMLRELAMEPEIGVNPGKNKSELVKDIAAILATPATLKHHLMQYRRRQLEFFREVANNHEIRGKEFSPSQYGLPHCNGLMTLYHHLNEFVCVMPEEIRKSFHLLDQSSFPAEWERRELVRAYARAVTELYGVVRVSEFIDIFNQQNDLPVSEGELLQSISEEVEMDCLIVEEDYLFNEIDFDDADWDEIESIVHEAESKPRYLPNAEEMLAYGQQPFISRRPQKEAAESFLKEQGINDVTAENLIDELEIMFQSKDWRLSDMSRLTNEVTKQMKKAQVERFISLVMEMNNNTRTWRNNGHTPNELRKIMGCNSVNLTSAPIRIHKVGRNELCTCGSGRKYKHCCGK